MKQGALKQHSHGTLLYSWEYEHAQIDSPCIHELFNIYGYSTVASPRGGVWTPTSFHTPPEICANPLRSVLNIAGPSMYIVTFHFLLLISKEKLFGLPLSWAGDPLPPPPPLLLLGLSISGYMHSCRKTKGANASMHQIDSNIPPSSKQNNVNAHQEDLVKHRRSLLERCRHVVSKFPPDCSIPWHCEPAPSLVKCNSEGENVRLRQVAIVVVHQLWCQVTAVSIFDIPRRNRNYVTEITWKVHQRLISHVIENIREL